MTKSKRGRMAGAATRALSLLSDPLDFTVLAALEHGPSNLAELSRAVGLPSQTTLRTHLRTLTETGVLTREKDRGFARTVFYERTPAGRELHDAADVLAKWLAARPDGPLRIGTHEAKLAIRALIGGWSTNMLRALAVKPLSVAELDRVIPNVNYPALERRLDAMRLMGLVTETPPNGGRPYGVTEWLRKSIAPLLAAAKSERQLPTENRGLSRLGVETIFLLAAPLLDLPHVPNGSCRIGIQFEDGDEPVELVISVHAGRARSSRAAAHYETSSWLSGPIAAWFEALDHGMPTTLKIGGDKKLPEALVVGLGGVAGAVRASPY